MKRIDQPEWMDDPSVAPETMTRVLDDLRRVNTFFGGLGPILRTLWPLVRRAPSPVTILDIAAGDAFILRRLVDMGRREGIPIHGIALDLHPVVNHAARRACKEYPEIEIMEGDALNLPFDSGSIDFAISCLALHHFGMENAPLALREMRRTAHRGFVVNDLRRSRLAYAITSFILPLLRSDPITRHDGPVSIQRAFNREEYLRIIQQSGINGMRYRERLWFRSVLWWELRQ